MRECVCVCFGYKLLSLLSDCRRTPPRGTCYKIPRAHSRLSPATRQPCPIHKKRHICPRLVATHPPRPTHKVQHMCTRLIDVCTYVCTYICMYVYRKSMENLWKIYGKSMENLSKIYRKSIENLSKSYRKSIENLSKICRKNTKTLQYRARWSEIENF